jgi:hypothetical protein
MNSKELVDVLVSKYGKLIFTGFDIPNAHEGKGEIKAIILGADPTHIVGNCPKMMEKVFGLEKAEKSPYWRGINKNLRHIGLTLNNVYVQNVCRNYFDRETSKNEKWEEIASNYWIPLLKEELDSRLEPKVPIIMTTQFILWAALESPEKKINAKILYYEHKYIPEEDNKLRRKLYAVYRHPYYSLTKSEFFNYRNFLTEQINLH